MYKQSELAESEQKGQSTGFRSESKCIDSGCEDPCRSSCLFLRNGTGILEEIEWRKMEIVVPYKYNGTKGLE